MHIVEGNYYKTRGGRKVGPMQFDTDGWLTDDTGRPSWNIENGQRLVRNSGVDDIVSLWQEPTSQGPVRTKTVTTTEIVPGDYGKVRIHPSPMRPVELLNVFVYQGDDDNLEKRLERATELRAAALVLTQLAEALE